MRPHPLGRPTALLGLWLWLWQCGADPAPPQREADTDTALPTALSNHRALFTGYTAIDLSQGDLAASDYFGCAVSLHGTAAAVGAMGQDSDRGI